MALNPVVAEVTARIVERSRKTRADYLRRMDATTGSGPGRGKLSCANWAHAFAGQTVADKLTAMTGSQPNLGVVTAYNDMLSAHQPFERFPEIIRQAAKKEPYTRAAAVLEDVIRTPISPELLPPDEAGSISQQTEDLVGPYLLHDFFLYHTLHQGSAPDQLYATACRVFDGMFEARTVKKWLGVFYRRFFTQQFKRSCMPEGVKALDVSLSPRDGWRMPGDACAKLWLNEVEKL